MRKREPFDERATSEFNLLRWADRVNLGSISTVVQPETGTAINAGTFDSDNPFIVTDDEAFVEAARRSYPRATHPHQVASEQQNGESS